VSRSVRSAGLSGVVEVQRQEPPLPKGGGFDDLAYRDRGHDRLYDEAEEIEDEAPDANEVVQGLLGDCWLMSTLSAAVRADGGPARVKNMITAVDGGYDVRFFERSQDGTWVVGPPVFVTWTFPVRADGSLAFGFGQAAGGTVLWPAIIEKAYAAKHGGYDRINSGLIDDPNLPPVAEPAGGWRVAARPAAEIAMEAIMGRPATSSSSTALDEAGTKDKIVSHVGGGLPVVVASDNHWVSVVRATDREIEVRDQRELPANRRKTLDWETFFVRFGSNAVFLEDAPAEDVPFEPWNEGVAY